MADQTPILCNPVSLSDFLKFCCTGTLPANMAAALRSASADPTLRAILCAAEMVGALEPLSAIRPGVCDPEILITRDVFLPPATIDANGNIIPSEERIISFCAPLNRSLVIRELQVSPGNLTAQTQPHTQPIYKKVNLGTFGENWCLPFEPLDAPGQFVNVQNIMVPPQGGFSVHVQNFNPFSEAIYHLKVRMWAAC